MTKLQKSTPVIEMDNVMENFKACTGDTNRWLKISTDKTEALLFSISSSSQPDTLSFFGSFTPGSCIIALSDSMRYLRLFESFWIQNSMKKDVIKISQSA